MRKSRKFISIILIAFIVVNSCGYILLQKELKPLFKHLAKLKIQSHTFDEPVDTIVVYKDKSHSGNAKIQIESEDELSFNNEMYDIISKTDDSVKITYFCIKDKNESVFEKAVAQLENSNSSDTTPKSLLTSQLRNLLIDGIEYQSVEFKQFFITASPAHFITNSYSQIILSKFSPPPEVSVTLS